MTEQSLSRTDIELLMISSDIDFCISMQKISPYLSFLGLPYFSMIAIESCKYLQIPVNDVHANNIRAKVKFLDDSRSNLSDTVGLLDAIWKDHRGNFKDKDIGEFHYKNHFVGNSLLLNYLISLSKRNTTLKELSEGKAFEVSRSVGGLIGSAASSDRLKIKNKVPFSG